MEEKKELFDKPLVYLINFEDEIKNKLIAAQFNCQSSFIESFLQLPNNQQYDQTCLKISQKIDSNLHEYDIVLLDLTTQDVEEYNKGIHALSESATGIYTQYPKKTIDLQLLKLYLLKKQIDDLIKKESIIIVFL